MQDVYVWRATMPVSLVACCACISPCKGQAQDLQENMAMALLTAESATGSAEELALPFLSFSLLRPSRPSPAASLTAPTMAATSACKSVGNK